MTRNASWHGLLRADTLRPTWYAVSSLVLGVVGSLLVVFGLIYSVAFAVFGVGLLLFNVVNALGERLLTLEASRALRLLDVPISLPPVQRSAGNPFRRAITSALDPRTYRRLLALLVGGVTGLLTALAALACWYLVLRGVLEVVFVFAWPKALDGAWGGSRLGAFVVHTLPGVGAWFGGPPLIRRAARARAQVLGLLVTPSAGADAAKLAPLSRQTPA